MMLSPKKERITPKRPRVDQPSPKRRADAVGGDESDNETEENMPKLTRKGNAQGRAARVVLDDSDNE